MGQCASSGSWRRSGKQENYKACESDSSNWADVYTSAGESSASKPLPRAERLGLPLPPCKSQRLAALQNTCHAIDPQAPSDPQVQSILKLCQSIFQCPNTLVVLLENERAFVREAMGTLPRDISQFPAWTQSVARSNQQVLVVPNVSKDQRFAKDGTVRQLRVQFFAFAPLVSTNGLRLGTLCCMDSKPREDLDKSQALILSSLAERVARQIEKDMLLQIQERENVKGDKASAKLKRAVDCVEDCIALVDVSVSGWHILYMNAAFDKLMGCSRDLVTNALVKETLQLQSGIGGSSPNPKRSLPQPDHEAAVQQGKEVTIQGAVLMRVDSSSSGSALTDSTEMSGPQPVNLMLRPAAKSAMRGSTGTSSSEDGQCLQPLQSEHLYFMVLEPVKQPQSRSTYGTPDSGFRQDSLDPDAGLVWDSSGADSWSSSMKGLELSHLLGSGSFGSVYSGRLYGTHVAVKIINEELHVEEGKSLEAMCGVALKHPHIINVLKVMVRRSGSTTASERNSSTHSFYAKPETLELEKAGAESTSLALQEQRQLQVIQENMQWEQEQQQQLQLQQEARANCRRTMAEDLEGEGCIKEPELACSWPALYDNSLVDEETPQDNLMRSSSTASSQGGFCLWNCMASQPCIASPMIVQSQTWLVMEFCDKGCLLDAVDKGWLHEGFPNRQPNMTAILATAYEVASALMYLHKRGIVHGDLSPVNVLLSTSSPRASEGQRGFVAKVADLGLARALNVNSRITTKTHGTLTHQPPETLAEGIISRATDIYSLGVLMWAMYTGSRPWAGLSHAQIVGTVASKREHLRLPPSMPRSHIPFAELTTRCLSYNVAERPNTEAILDALAEIHQGVAGSAEP